MIIKYLKNKEELRILKGEKILYIRKDIYCGVLDQSSSYSVLGTFLDLFPENQNKNYERNGWEVLQFEQKITIPEIVDIPSNNLEEIINLLTKFDGLPFDNDDMYYLIDPYPQESTAVNRRAIYLINR